MSGRQTEMLVVGGLVLGTILLGYLQLGAKSADAAADQAVIRGDVMEAARLGRECESADGGLLDLNERLTCIAHLVENESSIGNPTEARARLDEAFAEADREGLAVTADTRAALFLASSVAARDTDRARSEKDARAALALATQPHQRALANARLGAALITGKEAEEVLRTARAQFTEIEGPHGMNVALTEVSLGGALVRSNPQEAISVLESASTSYGMLADGGHSFQGIALGALAKARLDQDDREGAEADFKKAIPLIRAGFGDDSRFLQYELCNLGELLIKSGRDTEALEALEEGTRIATGLTSVTVICRDNYSRVLTRVGRRAEAHEQLATLLAEVKNKGSDELRFWAVDRLSRTLAWVESDAGL